MVGIGHAAPQLANKLQEGADEWVEVNAADLEGFDEGFVGPGDKKQVDENHRQKASQEPSTEAPKPAERRIYNQGEPFKLSQIPHYIAEGAKEVGEAMRNYGYAEIFGPTPPAADQSLVGAAATGVVRVSNGAAEYAAGVGLGGIEIASRGTAIVLEAVEGGVEYVAPPVVAVAQAVAHAATPLTAVVANAAPVVGSTATTMVTATAGAVGAAYNYFFGQAPQDPPA